jgi:hypothetical protein
MKSNFSIFIKRLLSRCIDFMLISLLTLIFQFFVKVFGSTKKQATIRLDESGNFITDGYKIVPTTFTRPIKSGQTIGDEVLHIGVFSKNNNLPTRKQLFFREIIFVYPLLLIVIFQHISLVEFENANSHLSDKMNYLSGIFMYIFFLSCLILPFSIFINKEGYSILDNLTNTKVINTDLKLEIKIDNIYKKHKNVIQILLGIFISSLTIYLLVKILKGLFN